MGALAQVEGGVLERRRVEARDLRKLERRPCGGAVLERKEKVKLVPLLIMQGALDDNVLPSIQEKFVATYKAAGGAVDYHLFEGSEHQWVAQPGPQTDKARAMVKAFIARQLKS